MNYTAVSQGCSRFADGCFQNRLRPQSPPTDFPASPAQAPPYTRNPGLRLPAAPQARPATPLGPQPPRRPRLGRPGAAPGGEGAAEQGRSFDGGSLNLTASGRAPPTTHTHTPAPAEEVCGADLRGVNCQRRPGPRARGSGSVRHPPVAPRSFLEPPPAQAWALAAAVARGVRPSAHQAPLPSTAPAVPPGPRAPTRARAPPCARRHPRVEARRPPGEPGLAPRCGPRLPQLLAPAPSPGSGSRASREGVEGPRGPYPAARFAGRRVLWRESAPVG